MAALIANPQNARSRRTVRELLAAARSLLEERGFEATTMAAVAERAGVTRRAAYLHFTSRAHLIAAVFDHVNEEAGFAESVAAVWRAPDPVAALDEWAAHIARFAPQVMAVARAVERMHPDDPDAAQQHQRSLRGRLGACRRLITGLAEQGLLASGWTVETATDMMLALTSLDVAETLLCERRWSRRRLVRHLSLLLRSTFVDAAKLADLRRSGAVPGG